MSLTGCPAEAWWYLIIWDREGKLCTFEISSHFFIVVCGTDTAQSVSPFFLHPWSTGGLLILIVSVPSLWNVTPLSPGQKMVVYPFSAILFTLMSDLVSPGSMFAFLAFAYSCSNGSCVVPLALSIESSGRYTVSSDGPVRGKFSSSVT